MKKSFKSLLASAMAMVMTVSLLPASVLAASVTFVKNFENDTTAYTVSDDTNFYLLSKDADISKIPDGAAYFVADDTDALIGTRDDGMIFDFWSFNVEVRDEWDGAPYLVTGDTSL